MKEFSLPFDHPFNSSRRTPHLDMLMKREQLMEDIDSIVTEQYGQGNEELANEMIRRLCDAVCKNFQADIPGDGIKS